jgi:hypothetical protein
MNEDHVTLIGIAGDMHRLFGIRQNDPALPVVDYALNLLTRSGFYAWAPDESIRQMQRDFHAWLGDRKISEGWKDDGSLPFAEYARFAALTQCLPSIGIGLARAALVTLHGFSAQGRATFRTAAEECLYAYMLLTDANHGRDYFADGMYKAARRLTKDCWNNWIRKPETHAQVPIFGLTYHRIFAKFIHGGSHAGFQQAVNRTLGTQQTYVDLNLTNPGGQIVSFASQVLQLVNDLVPLHPFVDRPVWDEGLVEFGREMHPILGDLQAFD